MSDIQPASAVWETHIAAGVDKTISVFHVAEGPLGNPQQIGYAIANRDPNGNWSWDAEGIIDENADPNVYGTLFDPSIAYDEVTGNFLVCALAFVDGVGSGPRQIIVARYDAATCQFGSWDCVAGCDPNNPAFGFDKPWIVAGQVTTPPTCHHPPLGGFAASLIQEFYIAWFTGGGNLEYRRSLFHGQSGTWVGGEALTDVDDPNSVIPIKTWPMPRVHNKRPLYVGQVFANPPVGQYIELWRGDDINCGVHAGEVEFTQLLDADQPGNPPIQIPYFRGRGLSTVFALPNGFEMGTSAFSIGKGVDMAVDPSNANRIFVVLHDTATAGPNDPNEPPDQDMNIYMHVLTRQSSYIWSLGPRIEVNNDVTLFEADQFMPMIDVGADGDVHVIFYDDRKYNETSDQEDWTASPNAQYDVFYAHSQNQGASWTNQDLFAVPSEPCIDYVDFPAVHPFLVRDYIGIDVGADRVWTSFMGSADADLPAGPNDPRDPSVIWSSQILPQ